MHYNPLGMHVWKWVRWLFWFPMFSHFCYLSNVPCGYMRVSGTRSSRPSFHKPQVAYLLTHLVLWYPWFCFVSTVGCFFFLWHKQKWYWYHQQPQHYPRKTPTRWSSPRRPATDNSRTFGTTSRFHHLKPIADGTPKKMDVFMTTLE